MKVHDYLTQKDQFLLSLVSIRSLSVVCCPHANAYDKQRRCRWKSLILIDEKIKMAAINKEFLLQLNLFVLLAIMRQQKKRKKHRFWVREIFQERQELGAYHTLIMGRVVSLGFILSQRHCRFLFISVVAGPLILLQRQVTTDNDLMETRL